MLSIKFMSQVHNKVLLCRQTRCCHVFFSDLITKKKDLSQLRLNLFNSEPPVTESNSCF